jgi:hypothetical protein
VISSQLVCLRKYDEPLLKHEAVAKALLLHHGNPTRVQVSRFRTPHSSAAALRCVMASTFPLAVWVHMFTDILSTGR